MDGPGPAADDGRPVDARQAREAAGGGGGESRGRGGCCCGGRGRATRRSCRWRCRRPCVTMPGLSARSRNGCEKQDAPRELQLCACSLMFRARSRHSDCNTYLSRAPQPVWRTLYVRTGRRRAESIWEFPALAVCFARACLGMQTSGKGDEDDEFFDAQDTHADGEQHSARHLAPASASASAPGQMRDEGAAAKAALERVRELNAVGRHVAAAKLLPSAEWLRAFSAEKEAEETRAFAAQAERALKGAREHISAKRLPARALALLRSQEPSPLLLGRGSPTAPPLPARAAVLSASEDDWILSRDDASGDRLRCLYKHEAGSPWYDFKLEGTVRNKQSRPAVPRPRRVARRACVPAAGWRKSRRPKRCSTNQIPAPSGRWTRTSRRSCPSPESSTSSAPGTSAPPSRPLRHSPVSLCAASGALRVPRLLALPERVSFCARVPRLVGFPGTSWIRPSSTAAGSLTCASTGESGCPGPWVSAPLIPARFLSRSPWRLCLARTEQADAMGESHRARSRASAARDFALSAHGHDLLDEVGAIVVCLQNVRPGPAGPSPQKSAQHDPACLAAR